MTRPSAGPSPSFLYLFYPKLILRSTASKRWTTCKSLPLSDFDHSSYHKLLTRFHLRFRTPFLCSQTGRAHLLLLSKTPGIEDGAIGVVTLEGGS